MKKLFALINTKDKTKEQLINEVWDAYQNYQTVENQTLNNKKRWPVYLVVIIVLAIAGYFIISNQAINGQDSAQVSDQAQDKTNSRPVSPEELAELQKDPSAPSWLKNAQSCNWIGEKVFCKLKGE